MYRHHPSGPRTPSVPQRSERRAVSLFRRDIVGAP